MPDADPTPDPKPAPRLGSYLLIEPLGSGGMSNVFRAVHEGSGNVVAVKVLPRTLAKNVTLLQRFLREAKSAEALDHPNIVAIYDRGFDQGRHYLVLEFVEGRDLHDRVRLNGPLAPKEAIRFIREVAGGLQYASSLGMVHRDVKPANLLMTPDGHAKIIDLGLALQTDDEDERVTRDGTTVGTVDYMAPEQARDSHQTSERSDIYSLGCTFYYLLTGSPPFPGGGLADKLARHFKAPIPDVRAHRTDVSEELSLLIRKMMEKKPELRFADYNKLIAALDALGNPAPRPGSGEVLDALIVDDDDEEIGLAPTESAIDRAKAGTTERPPSTRDHLPMAEIVDDDDDDDLLPSSPRSSTLRIRPRDASPPTEISLADLAALDSDEGGASRRSGKRPSPSSPTLKANSSSTSPRLAGPSMDAIIDDDDDDDEPVHGSGGPARRSSGDELPLKTWIAAGVLVGLAIAVVGFAVTTLIPMLKPVKAPEVVERLDPEPEPIRSTAPVAPPPRTTGPKKPAPPTKSETKAIKPATKAPEVVVVPRPPEEKSYGTEWESRFLPTSLAGPIALSDRSKLVVRRVAESGEEQTSSLASAFSRAIDVVEIADTGPFFEDDCQMTGKSRLVRARGGVRPMIRVDFTSNPIIKEQVAKFILGAGKGDQGSKVDHLVLEGLDIIVDVRVLPDDQTTLFLCQGVNLTLRDCSLTVINASDPTRTNRFSLFRLEDGPRPNRVVLERSTVRGPIRTLFDVAAAKAEIVLDRSLVVGDAGPLISLEPADKPSRALYFHRSLVATRGVVLELTGKSTPPRVRSLGTTFARIDGANVTTLFATRTAFAGEPASILDWSGEDNHFVGWSTWLVAGSEVSTRVGGLGKIGSAWPNSDTSSRESAAPWPAWALRDDLVPTDFATLAVDRQGTLAKIATPHPRLKELTIGSLTPLAAPELSASLIPPFVPDAVKPPAVQPKAEALRPPQPNALGPSPRKFPVAPIPGGMRAQGGLLNVNFNPQDPAWEGDLGKFLAETLIEGTTRATIQVRGNGLFAMSPVRLPDGLSIAILGEPNGPMPTFVPKAGSAGRSMFELHGGDLAIANLAFSAENSPRPRHWVLVEDGLLALRHCRFRDPGGLDPEVLAAISFVAKGTAPIASRVGPLQAATNLPIARLTDCLIWTGTGAISAELGRGVVDLENCLILSGGPAVSLWPQNVARDKFEADLIMNRCTIANEKTSFLLNRWPGDPSGPDRPWLVSTRRCVFPRTQTGGAGALLQVDPDAMARGTLFWQSSGDAYDVGRFLASNGPQPTAIPPADLKKQWIDLWGQQHARFDLGPPRRNDPILHFKDKDRLKPGRVVPGNLELDVKVQKDLGVDFKKLPPTPRG